MLDRSPIVQKKYSEIIISHVCGVRADPSFDFLLCLRNPISLAHSAFSWRKKLVVQDALPDQRGRFPGEYEVLPREYEVLPAKYEVLPAKYKVVPVEYGIYT